MPCTDRTRLWVIDGCKARRNAIVQTFCTTVLIQHCQEHKRYNVVEHLPEAARARDDQDAAMAARQLQRLAGALQAKHPGAAASMREGIEETLTLQSLGISGALSHTLRSTNPTENLNGSIAHYTRNVMRWRNWQMTLRWVACALSEAKQRFRKPRAHRDIKPLRSLWKPMSLFAQPPS